MVHKNVALFGSVVVWRAFTGCRRPLRERFEYFRVNFVVCLRIDTMFPAPTPATKVSSMDDFLGKKSSLVVPIQTVRGWERSVCVLALSAAGTMWRLKCQTHTFRSVWWSSARKRVACSREAGSGMTPSENTCRPPVHPIPG